MVCNSLDNGGGAALLFRITRYLDKSRVAPTLFLDHDGWQAQQQRATGYADYVIDPDLGATWPTPSWDRLRPLAGALGRMTLGWARAVRRIARLVAEREIDVIAGFGIGPGVVAALAGTLAQRPVIWSAQTTYDSRPLQALALLPAVKRIFAVSRAAAAPFSHVPEKVEVTYNGIDPDDVDPTRITPTLRARHGVPATVPLVGLAGRLVDIKGVDLFLQAAANLAARHAAARFVVIGRREDDAFDAELTRLASVPALAGRVIFTGWVEDMRGELLDLDVVAIPSRRDAAPLVCYEAMALGRAIVASRVPGLDEQLRDGETGLYFGREDVAGLTARIDRLLTAPRLRARLGAAARQDLCARFDLRRMVKRVEDAIVTLAAG
jgi:glycosyltransferase involved in cell wall biosynthesis